MPGSFALRRCQSRVLGMTDPGLGSETTHGLVGSLPPESRGELTWTEEKAPLSDISIKKIRTVNFLKLFRGVIFISIKFTYFRRTIHDSQDIHRVVKPSPPCNLRTFPRLSESARPSVVTPHGHPQPQATINLLSVSTDLPTLGIAYKSINFCIWLLSLSRMYLGFLHVLRRVCSSFSQWLGHIPWGSSILCLSIHELMDVCVISRFLATVIILSWTLPWVFLWMFLFLLGGLVTFLSHSSSKHLPTPTVGHKADTLSPSRTCLVQVAMLRVTMSWRVQCLQLWPNRTQLRAALGTETPPFSVSGVPRRRELDE